ncbi:CRISPR-associated endonuclease Cas2 [Actinosynnema sp. NPDC050436]|uniref:CRISPR-associated endonuclease Cas2 n=1 Tax=Actinosynnema sp. NPDC050436 TaxID=3155659 RepID=UPI0033E0173A
MELLVTYDVDTTTPEGERRLRQVAKICEGVGHRVQKSVFGITCTPAQRLQLEARLQSTIDSGLDSVRIYHLDRGTFHTARHLGAAVDIAHTGAWII